MPAAATPQSPPMRAAARATSMTPSGSGITRHRPAGEVAAPPAKRTQQPPPQRQQQQQQQLTGAAASWRLELFFKSRGQLDEQLSFLATHGLARLNLPNKAAGDDLLGAAAALMQSTAAAAAQAAPGDGTSSMDVCVHFSLKYNYNKSPEAALAALLDTLRQLGQLQWQHGAAASLLLVSGGGARRRFDSLAALQQLAAAAAAQAPARTQQQQQQQQQQQGQQAAHNSSGGRGSSSRSGGGSSANADAGAATAWPPIAVAFNPYLLDEQAAADERVRLTAKLATGLVSEVYLQMGTDLGRLRAGLRHLDAACEQLGAPRPRLLGSVFVPSKRLLAQMRFRPWSGVHLGGAYLASVGDAQAITAQLLREYARAGVVPLVESAVRSDGELRHVLQLLGGGGGGGGGGAS